MTFNFSKISQILQTQEFDEWLNSLQDRRGRSLILRRIDRLRLGNPGDWKSVGDGIVELRIFFGPGYRLYLTQVGETIILLLCGGDKSSQKADIYEAKLLAEQTGNPNGIKAD